MSKWIFAAAVTAFSTAVYSQTNTAPAPVIVPGSTNMPGSINTEPGYVPPPRTGMQAPDSAAGGTTSSTPGTLGTSSLGDGLGATDLSSRLFDPILPPGVGTGTAAPGGSQNPSIPGR